MNLLITSQLIVAASHCARKVYFLLHGEPQPRAHEYEQVVEERTVGNRAENFSRDVEERAIIIAGDLAAQCDAVRSLARSKREPRLAIGTHTPTPSDKLRLAFAGYVLGEQSRSRPSSGALVPFGESPKRVKLEPLYPAITTAVKQLRTLVSDLPADPPPLDIRPRCQTCEFRNHCMAEAERTDSLFLLEKMTPKLVAKYHKKGIFTVTQLSYVYRPRRRKKRAAKSPTPFNVELQALAIRTKKIYLHERPTLQTHPVELFLDIEGIPDEGFNYLVGMMVKRGETTTMHSFWANGPDEERRIFDDCVALATQYSEAPIYHYGVYERRAVERTAERHGLDWGAFLARLVNVNRLVYGKVYFPTRSNRLKDLGTALGASWPMLNASGIHSVAWRYRWEETGHDDFKLMLLSYNEADCSALRLLTTELQALSKTADSRLDVDFSFHPKLNSTPTGTSIHEAFDGILQSAQMHYRQKRIRVHADDETSCQNANQNRTVHARRFCQATIAEKPGKVVRVSDRRECPSHHSLKPSTRMVQHTLLDLTFTKNGCRKALVRYTGTKAYCSVCLRHYLPPDISALKGRIFGHGFQSWAVFLRVALRLPLLAVSQVIEHLFSANVNSSNVNAFVRQFADRYASTEESLLRAILASPVIHVDETKISIRGTEKYVWGLTDGQHVIFKLTDTRETAFLQKLLDGYRGVLVTDFYGGYDCFSCRQQKCLVHLIGDLNDDLWKNPFLAEYELFVLRVRDLLVPIFKDVERYGLAKRHLNKHMKSVDRFYRQSIDGVTWESDLVRTYQKRFIRYRESLFLFLKENGVPWNNNMGERALRHMAVQRKISGSFFQKGATDYLLLLGIAQSCRFQGKSFLRFLLSEEKEVDAFKAPKRRRP
jgi:predicted RecB family nuclease